MLLVPQVCSGELKCCDSWAQSPSWKVHEAAPLQKYVCAWLAEEGFIGVWEAARLHEREDPCGALTCDSLRDSLILKAARRDTFLALCLEILLL